MERVTTVFRRLAGVNIAKIPNGTRREDRQAGTESEMRSAGSAQNGDLQTIVTLDTKLVEKIPRPRSSATNLFRILWVDSD